MLASVGFALCVGIALDRALALAESGLILSSRVIAAAFAAVLVAFTARSLTRDVVWRDNETLFRQTVLDVPSSHRAHWMRAADLAERKRTAEALEEMDLAIAFGDRNDPLLLEYGGDMFAMAGRCPRAVTLYRRALALAPRNIQLRSNTAFCLMKLGKVAEAKSTALALPDDAGDARLVRLAHVADSLLSLRTP
jgi:tetratricopeptide (TPR) repeat protein